MAFRSTSSSRKDGIVQILATGLTAYTEAVILLFAFGPDSLRGYSFDRNALVASNASEFHGVNLDQCRAADNLWNSFILKLCVLLPRFPFSHVVLAIKVSQIFE